MIKNLENYLITLHSGTWFEWIDSKNKIYSNLKLSDKVSVAGEVVDNPFSLPTEKECTDGLAQLQSDYDAKQHQRDRKYPPIGDQLDMLWHSIDQDAALKQKYFAFHQAILAVKSKYPK